jgi:hypothetical protein
MFNFNLTEEQYSKLKEWKSKHDSNAPDGAIGGRYTYSFTPTRLGMVVVVTDSITKEEIDLSNYDEW